MVAAMIGQAAVRVPASSANLGPGFDAVAIALGFHDTVQARSVPRGEVRDAQVHVVGSAAGRVPPDGTHLVVRSMRAAWTACGIAEADQPGLVLDCAGGVPFGCGVGSSAAAIVAGVALAGALLDDPARLPMSEQVRLASSIEGHADNAAASALGGLTLGFCDAEPDAYRAVRVEPHSQLSAVVCIPSVELLTSRARAMLPATVEHRDAAFNVGRTALLMHALTSDPSLLFEATEDRLHQAQRAEAMPDTLALLEQLRADGLAATISGAGPSLLVLSEATSDAVQAVDNVLTTTGRRGWSLHTPSIDREGAVLTAGPHVVAASSAR